MVLGIFEKLCRALFVDHSPWLLVQTGLISHNVYMTQITQQKDVHAAADFAAVHFKGEFRDYQQTVLQRVSTHLDDKKVHIVAAPGSGKTVLGLELIRHLGEPTLVLSPAVTIRQQWGERFEEMFLPKDTALDSYISFDLKAPRLITSVTYQALHAAMHHLISEECTDLVDEGERVTGGSGTTVKIAADDGAATFDETDGETGETSETDDAAAALDAAGDGDTSSSESLSASTNIAAAASEGAPVHNPNIDVEIKDFRDFDLVSAMKQAGIKVLCLDEAHHLRSEWHKALTAFIKEMKGQITIISLTATPPYDSTPAEWKRYEDLCGPIDEEIFVPELVIKKTLCPHQDYIYFSYPTSSEKEILKSYRRNAQAFLSQVKERGLVERMLRDAGLYSNFSQSLDTVLKNEKAFFTLFRLAEAFEEPVPQEAKSMLKRKRRYFAQTPWRKSWEEFEEAFQFVIDNSTLFSNEVSLELKDLAAQHSLLERRKIKLLGNTRTSRMLASSMGKLNGVAQIATIEQANLGKDLRMLVLTDYIKKELIGSIGTNGSLSVMGAVPLFETIRRAVGGSSSIALLSGSLVIVANEITEPLASIAARRGAACRFRQLGDTGYSEALFSSSNKDKVAVMTEAFQLGHINIMVGTKALLGEGWDSPCINALILASFVGSFMLSNQMRGRAIRIDKNVPNKTANIWHLVTLEPIISSGADALVKLAFAGEEKARDLSGSDWNTLVRRFDSFMGPAYSHPVIESGIERIDILTPPFDEQGIGRINALMEARARNREAMAQSWQDASPAGFYPVVEVAAELKVKPLPTTFVFNNILPALAFIVAEFLASFFLRMSMGAAAAGEGSTIITVALLACMVVMLPLLIRALLRAARVMSPKTMSGRLANALLLSLKQTGHVKSPGAKVHTVSSSLGDQLVFSLRQASVHEKNIFAQAVSEMLSPIDNPKYLLIKRGVRGKLYWHSYACPAVLSAKKADAEMLQDNFSHFVGRFDLVFTYNAEGREALWKSSCRSYVNINEEITKKLTTM